MSTTQKPAKAKGKNISTYCRIRPPEGISSLKYRIQPSDDAKSAAETIQFQRSPDFEDLSASAKERRTQTYAFNTIFKEDDSQEKLFQRVGKPVVENAINGYNGTIFAYGQTATGKTYTIMGEELEYEDAEDRGLIPRALEHIFAELDANDGNYDVKISFLEIYKEVMYDLLNLESYVYQKKSYTSKRKITCKMDDDKVRLEGLTYRKVANVDDAIDVFLEGNQAREVAETYANDRSSRSHVVFTVYIEREDDTGRLESKLHFVDLAGSERVSKDHLGSNELNSEAKGINQSLMFLHKVIKSIATNQKPETFRNTMITKILRDSLVGNSMTTLIATISVELDCIDETISTCKFAQSVSKIKTKPVLNKTKDLHAIIARLQAENQDLNERLQELTQPKVPTDDEKVKLKELVLLYYNDDDPDACLEIEEDNDYVQYCFQELKTLGRSVGTVASPQIDQPSSLTDEDVRALNSEIDSFLARNDSNARLEYGGDSVRAQYCFNRLKLIVKDFDDRPKKKKGCC